MTQATTLPPTQAHDEPATETIVDPDLMAERRDVKVKLPAALVLRLYYLKLTTSLNYSDVVEEALNKYFAEIDRDSAVVSG